MSDYFDQDKENVVVLGMLELIESENDEDGCDDVDIGKEKGFVMSPVSNLVTPKVRVAVML